VAQVSCLGEKEQADGEERHGPEGKLTVVHRDDQRRGVESDRERQQQGSDDQSLERDDARGERQPALQRWEAALDEQGQAAQQGRARGGDGTGGAAKVRAR
jgi:hypothetical protein